MTTKRIATQPDPSVVEQFPGFLDQLPQWVARFKTSPFLAGMTSDALVSGIAKDVLRGRYFDCEQDLEDVLFQRDLIIHNSECYKLPTSFLGGLPNDGGMENREAEKAFSFD